MRGRISSNPALRFLLFAAFLFLILALRKPDSITNAQFCCEDGQVFYADQLTLGWQSLVRPYNGYLSLITRLAAAAESLFPALFAPLICSIIGLAVQAASYAMLILPECRYLIRPDAMRIAVALVLATALDGSEMVGNSVNAQWHVLLPGLILLFLPNSPDARGNRITPWDALAALAAILIALSASIFVIALPFALFRAVARAGRERLVASTFTLGIVIQICYFVATSPTMHAQGAVAAPSLPATSLLAFTFVAWLYRVLFTTMLGKATAISLRTIGTPGAIAASLLIAAAFAWAFWRSGKPQRIRLGLALYFTVASLILPLVTRNLIGFFQPQSIQVFTAPRYFTTAAYILLFAVAGIVTSLPFRIPNSAKAAAFLAIFSYATVSNFAVDVYPDMHWAISAQAIDQWREDRTRGYSNPQIRAPIIPQTWVVELPELRGPARE